MKSELTNDTSLTSEEFKKGAEAWKTGDIAAAEKEFSKLAHKGNARALYWLGRCYDDLRFASHNPKKSDEYFVQAAEAGYVPAYLEVVERLLQAKKDLSKAAKFLSLALEKGVVDDDRLLYYLKSPESKIVEEAKKYLSGSVQGYPKSFHALALLALEEGKGTSSQALQFFTKASEQGDLPSQVLLALAQFNGTWGVQKNEEKAFQSFQELAKKGSADAHYFLGICYWRGRGCPRSQEQASKAWEKATQLDRRYIAYRIFTRILEGKCTSEELLQTLGDFKYAASVDTWAHALFARLDALKIWETVHKNGILAKFTTEVKRDLSTDFERFVEEGSLHSHKCSKK